MSAVYTLSGELKANGTIELDEVPPLSPGPVLLHIERADSVISLPLRAKDSAERRARLAALAGSVSDEDTREILATVEREFEQINLDEWR